MTEETLPGQPNGNNAPQKVIRARGAMKTLIAGAIAIAVGTALVHIQSYWWSESIQFCDVTLTLDEGLMSLNVPLVRIAAKETPRSHLLVYKREPSIWSAGAAGKTPLRSVMKMLDQLRADGAMFADFGYWKGAWQSDARPGAFVVAFVPIWFVGALLFGTFVAIIYGRLRFRLRTLLAAITLFAGLLYLWTLRAAK